MHPPWFSTPKLSTGEPIGLIDTYSAGACIVRPTLVLKYLKRAILFDRNPHGKSASRYRFISASFETQRGITFHSILLSMRGAERSSEVPHLADETHGDLPPLAGHLHFCAVDRRPLEALVVAPKQARGAAPSGILAIPRGGRGDVCLSWRT